MKQFQSLPVAVVGGGPVGLAAAAHLTVRNIPFILFEAGETVVSNIRSWEHVRVFSPWKYNIDKAARQLLEAAGWSAPDEDGLPTGKELYESYFRPLAALEVINPNIHTNSRVMAIGRKNMDKMKSWGREEWPFVMQVHHKDEGVKFYEVRAVIDASGTWNSPNPIGSGGVFAVGELENKDHIVYGIPDVTGKFKHRYQNKSIAVVGGGHSAINTIIELDKLKDEFPETTIHWILRKKNIMDVYGGQEKDALEARGALGIKIEQLVNDDRVNVYTPFQVQEIRKYNNQLMLIGYQNDELQALPGIDEIISNTGSRPDFSFLREVRLRIDSSLESSAAIAELIDPNIHSCGTVRPHGEKELRHDDEGFYIVGSKSYGRAPTFLMATGYEQVRSVVAAIDGDMEAARKVELELPETGVCSTDAGVACCGTEAVGENETAAACCG
ncbi:MAG TPA: NAD(P)-binding domain-containing protein [Chitinophagaceae bacterium]